MATRYRAATRDLPNVVRALVLSFLDADDVRNIDIDPARLSPQLAHQLRGVRAACGPETCRAMWRSIHAAYYNDELQRGVAAQSEAEREDDGGEEEKRPPTDMLAPFLNGRCWTPCMADTAALEEMLETYMDDAAGIIGTREYGTSDETWEAGERVLQFSADAADGVTGEATFVACALKVSDGAPNRWELYIDVAVPDWTVEPPNSLLRQNRNERAHDVTRPQNRALTRFMRDVFSELVSRVTAGSVEMASPPQWYGTRFVYTAPVPTPSTSSSTPSSTPTSSPEQVSPETARVFARVIRAIAYALATTVVLQPSNEAESENSPLPAYFARVRRAFPTLPIRVRFDTYKRDWRVLGCNYRRIRMHAQPLSLADAVYASGIANVTLVKVLGDTEEEDEEGESSGEEEEDDS